MWRVLREHVKGFERACGGLREKVLQGCNASTAENMKFSGKKIIAIKSDNILPYFKANLFLYQTLPLKEIFSVLFCESSIKTKLCRWLILSLVRTINGFWSEEIKS